MRPHLRSGTAKDLDGISRVLVEAAEWLMSIGMPLWDPRDLGSESLIDDVCAGRYLVSLVGDRVVGTVRLQLADPQFWPEAADGEAAYVHRLAVSRCVAKTGLSLELLRFAAHQARALGRPLLRLDCVADRTRLRGFYEAAGFRHHSDRQCGPYFVARYEKAVD
jgi:GNAT superfamily N-acetyltransferase